MARLAHVKMNVLLALGDGKHQDQELVMPTGTALALLA